ncbi:ParB/RepB/Spo0J family partition protein [uncultured Pseudodesulfovibrio sp.]|uniref:ParB/RepB/Spo0J family partition protein n=1 Tax=uncultured Pseudodesulfovibrio sp. TaxID=2035858 RepID=UPI0029C8D485|nr:ParB/RepB/Spo0J family partition protein [uncultured Pseudodesulfovibrio sp.]
MQLSSEILTSPADTMRDTGPHLFWSDNPQESLKNSIEEFGQTTPILVQKTNDGLEVIAGHARVSILREQGKPVLARLVEEADDVEKGLLYLADNAQRPLDDAMRFAALRYFRPLMDEKRLRSDILQRLGVKPKSKDAKLFAAWLDMPENWQEHLLAGRVPLAAGIVLGRMEEADRDAVEPLFANFAWSRSNGVNMLTWLFEAGKMASCSTADIMERAGVNEILKQGLSPKDCIARLNAAVKDTRYPELSALQERFAKAAREITAGTRWRLSQPNNFETGGAEMTVQIKDADQLAKAVKDLETIAGESTWKTLWKLGGKND